MDETSEAPVEKDDVTEPVAPITESLMPLSMPPTAPLSPDDETAAPSEATGTSPSEDVTPPLGTPAVTTSPMPLSMPPFHAQSEPASGAGSIPPSSIPPEEVPPGQIPPVGDADWYPASDPSDEEPPRRQHKTVLLGVAAALLVGGLGAGLGATFGSSNGANSSSLEATPSSPTKPLSGTSSPEARIYAAVEPAVVDINTDVASAGEGGTEQAGTGMIVTASGEILTNNHVVDQATSITVTVQHHSGPLDGKYSAKVIGVDPTSDVALLQIEGISNLPHVSLGNSSSLAVGQTVYAIGNALGFGGQPSVQAGTITALGRTITASDESTSVPETLHNLIQSDAQIEPGDSGGPLVNASGRVVGMDTAAASTDGDANVSTGFSIPINAARTIANNIANGKAVNGIIIGLSPFLGVELSNGSNASTGVGSGGSFGFGTGNTGTTAPIVAGAQVLGVVAGSPAAKAGLQAGDVITVINGSKVSESSDVSTMLAKFKDGDTISVTYVTSAGVSHSASAKLVGIPH